MAIFNGYAELRGPFSANQKLIGNQETITDLGIQSKEGHRIIVVCADGQKELHIGSTGILELHDTDISEIYFLQDEPADTILDFLKK